MFMLGILLQQQTAEQPPLVAVPTDSSAGQVGQHSLRDKDIDESYSADSMDPSISYLQLAP